MELDSNIVVGIAFGIVDVFDHILQQKREEEKTGLSQSGNHLTSWITNENEDRKESNH